jgi:drug/metabolite transporter (DMT)-like permease
LPVWLVLLDWIRPNGARPTGLVLAGLALGLGGVAILVGPASLMGGERIDIVGTIVLMLGSISWAAGSLYSKQASMPGSPALGMAMQMLAGGALLTLAGTFSGEWSAVNVSAISMESALAILYLIVFGSLIGFTAYMWLLQVAPPARVATYAYVNPIVAVFLGWLVLGEAISGRTVLAAGIIVGAVALIVTTRTGGGPSSGGRKAELAKEASRGTRREERPAA